MLSAIFGWSTVDTTVAEPATAEPVVTEPATTEPVVAVDTTVVVGTTTVEPAVVDDTTTVTPKPQLITVDPAVLETLMAKVAACEAKNAEIEAKNNTLAAKLAILAPEHVDEEPPESVTNHPLWLTITAAENRRKLQQFMTERLGDRVVMHFAVIDMIKRLIPTKFYHFVDGVDVKTMTIDYAGFQNPTGTRQELLAQIDTLWITNPRKAIYIACDLISGRATDYATNFNSGLFTEFHPQPAAVKRFSDAMEFSCGVPLHAYKWIWSPNVVEHMAAYNKEEPIAPKVLYDTAYHLKPRATSSVTEYARSQEVYDKHTNLKCTYYRCTNGNIIDCSTSVVAADTKYGTLGICGMVRYSDVFPNNDRGLFSLIRQNVSERYKSKPRRVTVTPNLTPIVSQIKPEPCSVDTQTEVAQTEVAQTDELAAWRSCYGITDEKTVIRAHT